METTNPAGNTSGKSYGTDLHQPINRQGMLTDLGPSSPGPPRAAAVAHQMLQGSERRFLALRPAAPGGHGAAGGQEEPLHDSSRVHMAQTLNTGVHARFSYMPPPPSYPLNREATLSPIGLAQEHPPVGESPDPAWTTGQTGASPFGEALEAPYGGESGNLFDLVVNRLLSEDYAAYDPEDLNLRALMADYEAMFPDTGAALPTGPDRGHPPMGEYPGPGRPPGPTTDATPPGGAFEALSDQTTMASGVSGDENANLFDLVMNRVLSEDYAAYDPEDPNVRALMADYEAMFPDTGAALPTGPDQGHPPMDEYPGPGRPPGPTTDATPPGGAFEALSDQTTMASGVSGDENANLFDLVMNRVLSEDYAAYDPEDPNLRALMADYEAIFPDTGAALPTGPDQGHPPMGEYPGPGRPPGPTDATPFGGAFEALSDQTAMASGVSGDESGNLFDVVMNRLLSEDYAAYDPEDLNLRALMADYEATFPDTGAALPTGPGQEHPPMASDGEHAQRLTESLVDPIHARKKKGGSGNRMLVTGKQRQAILHIFKTDPEKDNRSIADQFGISILIIRRLRKEFGKTGNLKAGDHGKRLTDDERRAILHIFETDPKRSSQSIVDEFNIAYSTIMGLRKRFGKTGNLKAGDHAKRLTDEQRRAILHIFETDPKRSSQSLADEFDVSYKTIQALKSKFGKTGNLKPGDHAKRLTDEQRQTLLHIFETDPARSSQSIADELGISTSAIQMLRKRFGKTGNIKAGDHANRMSDEQRQALLHIFETDPTRSSHSIADELGISYPTVGVSRRQFGKTGNLNPRNRANRLTKKQRRTLLHIFKTDPARSNISIADEFRVAYTTIQILKKRFSKTGNIKVGDSGNRLTDEQRRTLLHIFKTDPARSNTSLADGLNVNIKTIQELRKKFNKTGNIKPGDSTKHLSDEQRQALLHIFKTDPARSNQSIVDEFGFTSTTILLLRKRFNKTGDIMLESKTKHLSDEQHRAILHIFETDPERSNQSIADEFGVTRSTIQKIRKKVE